MPNVLIVAFDGLQPSQVTPELMPNLAAFGAAGVTFADHHAVFPTVTRVNAASMVTGRYPGAHGLAANTVVFRDYDPHLVFSALEPTLARVVAKTGRVLLTPTLGDILSRFGKEYVAVVTGTSGNAYVHNPNADRAGGATIHPEFCMPRGLHEEVIARFGPWPEEADPNTARMSRGTEVLVEYVLTERRPAVSLLWLSEPDHSQHVHGVGSAKSNGAIVKADLQLGKVLSWLERTGLEDETDVMVVSDHGHSTAMETVDIETHAGDAGFPTPGGKGSVVVAGNGGSVLFYVEDGARATADRLVAWLMTQPWCGALLASDGVGPMPGTLPASLVGAEGDRAPEVIMSFAWNSEMSNAGVPGLAWSASTPPGKGMHGSMSRQEMHNVLIARGPSFKRGMVSDTPSGNVDIAPTVLALAGVPHSESLDGRPLLEAFDGGPDPKAVEWGSEIYDAERELGGGTYRQQIRVSRVGHTRYVDDGNASWEPR